MYLFCTTDTVHDFFIDVTTIRAELKKLLLPHQELLVVTGTHELGDHHHIATAVFKAIRSDTIHSVGSDGVYRAKVVPHIDSAVLEGTTTSSARAPSRLTHHVVCVCVSVRCSDTMA